jgi:hypothetical protein
LHHMAFTFWRNCSTPIPGSRRAASVRVGASIMVRRPPCTTATRTTIRSSC